MWWFRSVDGCHADMMCFSCVVQSAVCACVCVCVCVCARARLVGLFRVALLLCMVASCAVTPCAMVCVVLYGDVGMVVRLRGEDRACCVLCCDMLTLHKHYDTLRCFVTTFCAALCGVVWRGLQ